MIIVCPNPECRSDLLVQKDWLGKVIRCKSCQKTITLKTYKKPTRGTSKESPEILRRKIIAFFKAILSGDSTAVRTLVKFSPKLVHTKDAQGRHPIHLATSKNKVSVLELLLSAGANIDARDDKGNTCLHYAISDNHFDLFEFLMAKGASSEIENGKNLTAKDLARTSENKNFAEYIDKNNG